MFRHVLRLRTLAVVVDQMKRTIGFRLSQGRECESHSTTDICSHAESEWGSAVQEETFNA